MRKTLAALGCAALFLGIISLADAAFPNPGTDHSRGRGNHHCDPPRCEPCMQLVDLTPQKKFDCAYACEPIPDCVPPAR